MYLQAKIYLNYLSNIIKCIRDGCKDIHFQNILLVQPQFQFREIYNILYDSKKISKKYNITFSVIFFKIIGYSIT